jgi:hypothetical protein
MQTVAMITRPWTKQAQRVLARGTFAGAKVVWASEFRRMGCYWLMSEVYRGMASRLGADILPEGEATVRDVVRRCRYLRQIDEERAYRAVVAAWRGCELFLERFRPDLLLGVDIDFYLYDVLERVARQRGVVHLAIIGNMIPGYARVTSRGALLAHRKPADEEIATLEAHLGQALPRPKYIERYCEKPGLSAVYRNTIREVFRHGYLRGRKLLDRDPFSFHYNAPFLPHWSQSRGLGLTHVPLGTFHDCGDFDSLKGEVAYIPLQWYPESTYDYWGYDIRFADAPSIFVEAGKRLAKRYRVVYKEHPACVGRRSQIFYDRLRGVPGAILLPSNVNNSDVLGRATCVVGYGTSTSLEAALRGIPLLAIDEPYFGKTRSTRIVRELSHLETLELGGAPRALDYNLITRILAGSIPGQNHLWSANAARKADWHRVDAHLGEHLEPLLEAALREQKERSRKEQAFRSGGHPAQTLQRQTEQAGWQ